jgi:hypothetical protein
MIIRSKIPQPKTGFFSLIIWPFVKIKAFIDEIYQALLSMIWAELFKNQANQYSELTHLIAFLVLSVLSMLFYHFEGLENMIILTFLVLWLIDTYLTKSGFKTEKYEQIILDLQNSDLIWKSFTPGEAVIKEQFKRTDITQISLVPTTHIGGAFRTVQAQVWRIFMIIHDLDGYLIDEEKHLTRALKKARNLAQEFNVPLQIANSVGNEDYVAEKISTFNSHYRQTNSLWKTVQTSTTVKIDKKFSMTRLKKIIKSALKEAGVFLFMVIMAGVMVQFGLLITFLIGPKIGLESPTLVLSISFTGVLSFFAPKIDWLSLITLAISIFMLLYSGFQHSREHRITINHKWLQYRIKGQSIAQIATKDINQLILLKEPKPVLLIIGHSGKSIEINKLEDDDEGEELYHHISKQLEKFKN